MSDNIYTPAPNRVAAWNRQMRFPQDNYPVRVMSTKFANSNSGNPMVTIDWEICKSDPVQFGDKQLDIDGVKIQSYHTITVFDKDGELKKEETEKARGYFFDLLQKMGWEEKGFDVDNPPHAFLKNKVADAKVYGKEQKSYKEPTPEQKAKGQEKGDIIKRPDGKDDISYQPQIEKVYGLSTVEVNRPY